MIVTKSLHCVRRRYYYFVGKTQRYGKVRWLCTALLVTTYLYRVSGLSYDVITYLIGFYLLQLLVSYLTPKGL